MAHECLGNNLSGQILLFLTGTSSLVNSSSIRGVPELRRSEGQEDPRTGTSYHHLDFSLNESQVFECFRGTGRRLPWPIKLLRR